MRYEKYVYETRQNIIQFLKNENKSVIQYIHYFKDLIVMKKIWLNQNYFSLTTFLCSRFSKLSRNEGPCYSDVFNKVNDLSIHQPKENAIS